MSAVTCQVTPGSDSGSTSACPWLWSEGTLTAYSWPVCKFDLILAILSVSTSVAACHLPLLSSFLLLNMKRTMTLKQQRKKTSII